MKHSRSGEKNDIWRIASFNQMSELWNLAPYMRLAHVSFSFFFFTGLPFFRSPGTRLVPLRKSEAVSNTDPDWVARKGERVRCNVALTGELVNCSAEVDMPSFLLFVAGDSVEAESDTRSSGTSIPRKFAPSSPLPDFRFPRFLGLSHLRRASGDFGASGC